jgi:hypothetical protein
MFGILIDFNQNKILELFNKPHALNNASGPHAQSWRQDRLQKYFNIHQTQIVF